ncbi:MAG: hypothetical protein OSJ56_10195 [Prevotella sp.]|uniref:hypothetical protein n=1 Tax=Bacteroidales TaxID=171549 RepID=UPI0025B52005|nr:hypothetical protein [Bacteroides acidifaciens]MCX4294413.1 hypothetical protein [Prevotella sp.]
MRLKLPSIIDYIWYIGEKFHQQEKSPGDGAMLIAICWYGSFFLPLLTLINKLKISLITRIVLGVFLIIAPFIFCRIRYNRSNKELIELQYHNKTNWGKRLLIIWAVLIIVVIVEFTVCVKTGVWHVGN